MAETDSNPERERARALVDQSIGRMVALLDGMYPPSYRTAWDQLQVCLSGIASDIAANKSLTPGVTALGAACVILLREALLADWQKRAEGSHGG